ncbi:MAG: amidohydrolase family protein, partial [candidate division WS1 bacterium]|nr:amidohydrolase family protein [candidate division WS1 bacterium]
MYDLLLRGGTILDGTGQPGSRAEVALAGDKIAAVAAPGVIAEAARVLDVTGLYVAPGFIDVHAHHDVAVLETPQMDAPLRQGVTLQVNGQCGQSLFPLRVEQREAVMKALPVFGTDSRRGWEHIETYLQEVREAQPAINVASFVGHGTLRAAVSGFEPRALTEEELRRLEEATAEALQGGAAGISCGLMYPPGTWATTEELIRIGRQVAKAGRLMAFHIRGEDERLEGAIAEALEVGEKSGVRVEISHLKASGQASWGKMPRALELIERAAERGVQVGFDCYPYTAGSTYLSAYLPEWMQEGGWIATEERLRDAETRQRLREELATVKSGVHYRRMRISAVATPENQKLLGKYVAEAAAEAGADLTDFLAELLLTENNAVMIIHFSMCEEDMELALAHPLGVIGTDSLAASGPGQTPHPRCYGSFPRVL